MSQRGARLRHSPSPAPLHPAIRADVQAQQEGGQERVPFGLHQPQGSFLLHLQSGQRSEAATGTR